MTPDNVPDESKIAKVVSLLKILDYVIISEAFSYLTLGIRYIQKSKVPA